ncbi:uncharacterized protein LOC118204346 [Stegodyphus dumicola]|uniref:uncharacterized protein LOC118204346 n=1 Tax=Stegodyphus dumicola TaxID=202533 RepID=UPI0015AC1D42|nr:uncharacterized protein LOC118204346 [Stegodyphus dumicola]
MTGIIIEALETPEINQDVIESSQKGYGAVVYNENELTKTSFVMSKARVAPIKRVTLHRLELLGAVIGARLITYIRHSLKNIEMKIYMWTDSEIVLHWVKADPTKWKQFVRNRCLEIQEKTDPDWWNYCPSHENPSDLLTRGQKVCNFKEEFQYNRENDNFRHNHKCFEVAEQLQATEAYFKKLVQELAKSKETVLDIKIAVWYDYFKKFKIEVYNLEVAVSKLMLNAFENLNTIEEGIQILELFKNYFEKEVIKRDLQRCIETLYDIFFKEANIVKQKLVEIKAVELPLLPMYGGTAFHVSILPSRMKQVYKVLKTASHMWSRKYDVKIEGYYQEVLDVVRELIHTLFLQWTKTIPKVSFKLYLIFYIKGSYK